MNQGRVIPWLYVLPALLLMIIFVIYPALNTIYLSLRSPDNLAWASAACQSGQPCWGIFENYRYALTSDIMREAFFNNLKWVVLMVGGTVLLGLLIAALANQVRYERLAKAIIFMPMAISFVGAGVIWKFVYDYNPQNGILNAIYSALGGKPIDWLTAPNVNTIALIVVGVWMWTGFCMTILASAIKGVPSELLEAARVDGSSEWHLFWTIIVPYIMPTLAVVITTMTVNVLKIFDIVYVMTAGNYGTQVIANQMYIEMYTNLNSAHAAAIATVLILIIVPVMIFNIRRFQTEERER